MWMPAPSVFISFGHPIGCPVLRWTLPPSVHHRLQAPCAHGRRPACSTRPSLRRPLPHTLPAQRQGWVVPAPANGSRIRPPGTQICTISRMSCIGFSVTWMRLAGFVYRNTPGRHPTGRSMGSGPLDAHSMYSLCWRYRPFCGRLVILSHTT